MAMDFSYMTPANPLWDEFINRMVGDEGCNFRIREEDGENIWNCHGDHKFATAILEDMGMNVPLSLAYFERNGGHCDCEIVFNVELHKDSVVM